MEELTTRSSCAPAGHWIVSYGPVVELLQHRRDHMPVHGVEVIVRTIQVSRHQRDAFEPVLLVVRLQHVDAVDLSKSIRIVGRLQFSRHQRLFFYRSRCKLRVDTYTSKEEKLLYTMFPGIVNEVGLDLSVLVDKLCRVSIVGVDATDTSSSIKHIVDTFGPKELFDRELIHKIKFLPSSGNDVLITFFLKTANNGRSN